MLSNLLNLCMNVMYLFNELRKGKFMLKIIVLFIFSTLIATLFVCIVSTQIILAEVQTFGLSISTSVRLEATMKDLLGLFPALYLLISAGFFIGFIIAKYAHQFIGGKRMVWYMIAGATTFPLTLYIIQFTMGLTIIASARTPEGLLLTTCCCIFSAWVFSFLTSRPFSQGNHSNNDLGDSNEK